MFLCLISAPSAISMITPSCSPILASTVLGGQKGLWLPCQFIQDEKHFWMFTRLGSCLSIFNNIAKGTEMLLKLKSS